MFQAKAHAMNEPKNPDPSYYQPHIKASDFGTPTPPSAMAAMLVLIKAAEKEYLTSEGGQRWANVYEAVAEKCARALSEREERLAEYEAKHEKCAEEWTEDYRKSMDEWLNERDVLQAQLREREAYWEAHYRLVNNANESLAGQLRERERELVEAIDDQTQARLAADCLRADAQGLGTRLHQAEREVARLREALENVLSITRRPIHPYVKAARALLIRRPAPEGKGA